MRIQFRVDELTLFVPIDSQDSKVLEHFRQKHFPLCQKFDNTVKLSRYDKQDKKRQLLYWVNSIQNKQNGRVPDLVKKQLFSYVQKRIIIRYEASSLLVKRTLIELKLLSHKEVIIRVKKGGDKHLQSVLKNYFKKTLLSNFLFKNEIRILLTEQVKEKLKQLLKMQTLYSVAIDSIYDKEEFSDVLGLSSANNRNYKKYLADENLKIERSYLMLHSNSNDSLAVVKKRYRTLRKKYHPDRVYTQDAATIKAYTKKFQTLFTAFEIIKASKLENVA